MDMFEPIRRYLHPKIIIVLLLGFSSGLPRLLVASTLSAWLYDSGVDKASIGLFAYVALPYSFNFVWAPLVDHLSIPYLTKKLGRRRSWMVTSQVAVMASLFWFSTLNPSDAPVSVAIAAILVAFFSASQDIVIDAFRTEYLDKDQYGEGAAVAVFGYRLGMLVAGAGALYIAGSQGWGITYGAMSLCMLVGLVTILIAREPNDSFKEPDFKNPEGWLKHAVIDPFADFMKSHTKWWLILIFVAAYRLSDGFIGFISTSFFLDIGFEKEQIATIAKLYGFSATIIGTFVGGAMLHKLGLYRSLFSFGVLQLLANLTYIILAVVGAESWALMLAITCDNLAGGMVTAAAIAFMMRLCQSDYTATQYALLASLASLASILLAGASGIIAENYGWVTMFSISGVLGIPCLLMLMSLKKETYLFEDMKKITPR